MHTALTETYATHLERVYGMSPSQYHEILMRQGGLCAICMSAEPRSKNGHFVVDHCHETGEIRGLLCHGCNVSIGKLGDDIEGVSRALHYLLRAKGKAGEARMVSRVLEFRLKSRSRAWVFQDHRQKAKLGEKACPWSVGWIDERKKRRSKVIGCREDAEAFAEQMSGQ